MKVNETFCVLISQIFEPDQRVIGYASCSMNATESIMSIRSETDEVAKQWILDASRAVRDHISRQAQNNLSPSIITELEMHGSFLTKLLHEVPEKRIVFFHANKQWTAETIIKSINTSSNTSYAYSHTFCSVLLSGMQNQAKVAPRIKSQRILAR